MIERLCLVAILLFFNSVISLNARQNEGISRNEVHTKSIEFFKAKAYDSALYYLPGSIELYRETGDVEGQFEATIMMVRVYMKQARLEEASALAQTVINIAREDLPESVIANGRALHIAGGISMARGAFKKALNHFNNALDLYKSVDLEKNPEVASLYHDFGSLAIYKGALDEALHYYLLGLDLRKNIFGEGHIDVVSSYESIGVVYAQKFEFEKALESFSRAINIVEESFGNKHPKLAESLSNSANVFTMTGQTTLALEYLERSLSIMRLSFPEEHPNISLILMNIGIAHMYEERYAVAMDYFQKAMAIQKEIFGEAHYYVAKSLDNVGIIHRKEKRYDEALESFEQALSIRKSLFGLNHPDVANSFQNIGEVFTQQQDYRAIASLEQAANIRKSLFGNHFPDIAKAYNQLGNYYQQRGDLEKALDVYQMALTVNIPGFDGSSLYEQPDIAEYREGNLLLASLASKAATLTRLYGQTGDLKQLEFAQKTYKLCHELIVEIRQKRMRHEDKLLLGKTSRKVYEGALDASYMLAEATQNMDYKTDAFRFAERSKAAILFESLSDSRAKRFSGLPDSLLIKERTLLSDQSFYQSQLLEPGLNHGKTEQLKEALFLTKEKLDELQRLFEESYPRYYQLKYQNKTLRPAEVQSKLSDQQALIEYFESENGLYTFVISRQRFHLLRFDKTREYSEMLDQYIDSFSAEAARGDFGKHFDEFRQASVYLHNKLMMQALSQLDQSVNHLIIIPSDGLAYVPLELLTADQGPDGGDYQQLNYVLNQYAVSYAPSASLLLQAMSARGATGKKSILAFAPDYKPLFPEVSNERSGLSFPAALRWNADEVNGISEYISGDYFTGDRATEQLFKRTAGNHGIVHLAMHALINDEKPMQSRLLFSQHSDSIEDGMLYTYELFNMELPADMVVLSACKTGLGKLEEGEGMMSLGRAFFYAGSPSIVASSWAVDDQSTAQLMSLFYKYIAEGKSKDRALQLAKRDFLQSARGIKTHPYYWAGFAVIGNASALPYMQQAGIPFGLWLLILVMLLAAYLMRKRKLT